MRTPGSSERSFVCQKKTCPPVPASSNTANRPRTSPTTSRSASLTPSTASAATIPGSTHLHPPPPFIPASLTPSSSLAREHGFESWPRFARHLETLRLIRSVEAITDPVAAFLEVACVPRHADHGSGTLEHAELILARYPDVASANIWTASVLADESAVRAFLKADPGSSTALGGPNGWDALTSLCFSRYLRLDPARSDAFVRTAEALLDAGASPNTGWYETIDHPNARTILESALYGAAGIARHPELTRLLLSRGADPNADEETAYHLPEGYNNTVMEIVLESGTLDQLGLFTMLLRKADWHDLDGLRLVLEHGGDPNIQPKFGGTALHHAVRRDNRLAAIELLLDHGADPSIPNKRDGRSATSLAARRGRADILTLFHGRGLAHPDRLSPLDQLIAACALADLDRIHSLTTHHPALIPELLAEGGTLLAGFAGNGNLAGVRCLLDLGVPPDALHPGDPYWDIAPSSTAIHVAAWRAQPTVVSELLARGTPVNALDRKGRTALSLAVKACVDSHWTDRRSPDSVRALLGAGASTTGIDLPTGYDEIDTLLQQHTP